MSDHLTKRLTGRHCVCGTDRPQHRSPLAKRAAEHAAALGVDVATVSLRHVTQDPQLLADLGLMDVVGLHRVCGWARNGRRMDTMAGAWVS